MKTQNNRVKTRFAPATQFEVTPIQTVPFRGVREVVLEQLKNRLLRQLLSETPDPDLNAPLRRAANEAAGAAWLTPYPLLFFPGLLEEKAWQAQRHQAKQRRVQLRSQELIKAAA